MQMASAIDRSHPALRQFAGNPVIADDFADHSMKSDCSYFEPLRFLFALRFIIPKVALNDPCDPSPTIFPLPRHHLINSARNISDQFAAAFLFGDASCQDDDHI